MSSYISRSVSGALLAMTLAVAVTQSGCAAVFPELGTRVGPAPAIETFEPPPPTDRHYILVRGAKLPPRTRDGREWDKVFGSLPDPYLKILVNDAELFRTDVESDTLEPKWVEAPKGNWPLKVGDVLRLEVWDNNPLVDHPIGQKDIRVGSDFFANPEQEIDFDGGVELNISIRPAKPAWGAGLWYELRTTSAYVTRLVDGSPASRAGLRPGDRILTLAGKAVDGLSSDDVSGLFNSIPAGGLAIAVQHEDGGTLQVNLKEGPIYAFFKDYGDPDKKE